MRVIGNIDDVIVWKVLNYFLGKYQKNFPYLREGAQNISGHCLHGSVGNGWDVVEKYISEQHTHEYNREK